MELTIRNDNRLNVEMADIVREFAAKSVRSANREFLRTSHRNQREALNRLRSSIAVAERLMDGAEGLATF